MITKMTGIVVKLRILSTNELTVAHKGHAANSKIAANRIKLLQIKKIGPQCVRVATAFLFVLVYEYGSV